MQVIADPMWTPPACEPQCHDTVLKPPWQLPRTVVWPRRQIRHRQASTVTGRLLRRGRRRALEALCRPPSGPAALDNQPGKTKTHAAIAWENQPRSPTVWCYRVSITTSTGVSKKEGDLPPYPVDARTTSSGTNCTCRGVIDESAASSSRISTAVCPMSALGCRIDDSGTTATAAKSMSS